MQHSPGDITGWAQGSLGKREDFQGFWDLTLGSSSDPISLQYREAKVLEWGQTHIVFWLEPLN